MKKCTGLVSYILAVLLLCGCATSVPPAASNELPTQDHPANSAPSAATPREPAEKMPRDTAQEAPEKTDLPFSMVAAAGRRAAVVFAAFC